MCMQCNNENKQKFDMFFCFVIFAQPPLKSIATQSSVEEASSQSVGESYFIELITKASLRKFHPHEPCFSQDIGLKMEGSFFPFCSHEQRFRARNWDGCYGLIHLSVCLDFCWSRELVWEVAVIFQAQQSASQMPCLFCNSFLVLESEFSRNQKSGVSVTLATEKFTCCACENFRTETANTKECVSMGHGTTLYPVSGYTFCLFLYQEKHPIVRAIL